MFVGHTGGRSAFVSFFYIDPEAKTGAIEAFNTLGQVSETGAAARPDTRGVLTMVRTKLFETVSPIFVRSTLSAEGYSSLSTLIGCIRTAR